MQTLQFSGITAIGRMGLRNTTLRRVSVPRTFFSPFFSPPPSAEPFSAYNFWNVKHMPGCSAAQVPTRQPLLALYQSQGSLWSAALCGASSSRPPPCPALPWLCRPAGHPPPAAPVPAPHHRLSPQVLLLTPRVWIQFSCHLEVRVWGSSRAVTSGISPAPTSHCHVLAFPGLRRGCASSGLLL